MDPTKLWALISTWHYASSHYKHCKIPLNGTYQGVSLFNREPPAPSVRVLDKTTLVAPSRAFHVHFFIIIFFIFYVLRDRATWTSECAMRMWHSRTKSLIFGKMTTKFLIMEAYWNAFDWFIHCICPKTLFLFMNPSKNFSFKFIEIFRLTFFHSDGLKKF